MTNYKYKKYTEVLSELNENGFSQLTEHKVFKLITDRYETWVGGGHVVLIEKFTDGYAAIYVDSENLPKLKKDKNV